MNLRKIYLKFYRLKKISFFIGLCFSLTSSSSIKIFSFENYDQDIDKYIDPSDLDYDSPLVSKEYQKNMFDEFQKHYYSIDPEGLSPWSKKFVEKQLFVSEQENLKLFFVQELDKYLKESIDIEKSPPIGRYLRPYDAKWFSDIETNFNFSENFELTFDIENRAIAIENIHVRKFPTNDPIFYEKYIPIMGSICDELQHDIVRIGTPLYIAHTSRDKAWSLVITPDCAGWVQSNAIARVSTKFLKKWEKAASKKLLSVIKLDHFFFLNGTYKGLAITGTLLPVLEEKENFYVLLLPVLDESGNLDVCKCILTKDAGVLMPILLTPRNIARFIKNQNNRGYGWGGEIYFENDCSSLVKCLFAPFGIYLPRNSGQQANINTHVDILDDFSEEMREEFLIRNGKKLLTLIYFPGHIMLYLGNKNLDIYGEEKAVAISFQTISSLRSISAREKGEEDRFLVGKSLILPLLQKYPENDDLTGFFDVKYRNKFRLIFLNEIKY